jgi:hypothetical protein
LTFDPIGDAVVAGIFRRSAASAGLGARFNVMNRVSGYIEVADPLTGSVATRGDHGRKPRFFFSLSATL